MTQWTQEELEAIYQDPNLYISIPNPDGTMHDPAWVWIAQAGQNLYAHGYSGQQARWYQSAKRECVGHISVVGVEKDVRFEFPEDEETLADVDEGYKQKYAGSSYLPPMIRQEARLATIRIIPTE